MTSFSRFGHCHLSHWWMSFHYVAEKSLCSQTECGVWTPVAALSLCFTYVHVEASQHFVSHCGHGFHWSGMQNGTNGKGHTRFKFNSPSVHHVSIKACRSSSFSKQSCEIHVPEGIAVRNIQSESFRFCCCEVKLEVEPCWTWINRFLATEAHGYCSF